MSCALWGATRRSAAVATAACVHWAWWHKAQVGRSSAVGVGGRTQEDIGGPGEKRSVAPSNSQPEKNPRARRVLDEFSLCRSISIRGCHDFQTKRLLPSPPNSSRCHGLNKLCLSFRAGKIDAPSFTVQVRLPASIARQELGQMGTMAPQNPSPGLPMNIMNRFHLKIEGMSTEPMVCRVQVLTHCHLKLIFQGVLGCFQGQRKHGPCFRVWLRP